MHSVLFVGAGFFFLVGLACDSGKTRTSDKISDESEFYVPDTGDDVSINEVADSGK